MRESLRRKIIEVCETKTASKAAHVGLSFYAFFANKNDDPELLMEAAEWWIFKSCHKDFVCISGACRFKLAPIWQN